ncbi:hypothetical protein MRBLPE1_004965 [Paenibacillus sp. LPE1-1-1.1]
MHKTNFLFGSKKSRLFQQLFDLVQLSGVWREYEALLEYGAKQAALV